MPDDEKLLTITQAAKRLGVHYQTLRKWADAGRVPVVRLPSGYRRFEPAVIDQIRAQWGFEDAESHRRVGDKPRRGDG